AGLALLFAHRFDGLLFASLRLGDVGRRLLELVAKGRECGVDLTLVVAAETDGERALLVTGCGLDQLVEEVRRGIRALRVGIEGGVAAHGGPFDGEEEDRSHLRSISTRAVLCTDKDTGTGRASCMQPQVVPPRGKDSDREPGHTPGLSALLLCEC
ncbi:hypothetical protein, partial [Microbacterium sp. NPDC055665]